MLQLRGAEVVTVFQTEVSLHFRHDAFVCTLARLSCSGNVPGKKREEFASR